MKDLLQRSSWFLLLLLSFSFCVGATTTNETTAYEEHPDLLGEATLPHEDIFLSFGDLDQFSELGLLDSSLALYLKRLAEAKHQATRLDQNVTEALLLMDQTIQSENLEIEEEAQSVGAWPLVETATSLGSYFTMSNFLYLIGFGSVALALTLLGTFAFALFGKKPGIVLVDVVMTLGLFFYLRPALQEAERVFFLNFAYILYAIFQCVVCTMVLEFHKIVGREYEWLNFIPTLIALFTLSDFMNESVEGEALGTKWVAWIFLSFWFGLLVFTYTKLTAVRKAKKQEKNGRRPSITREDPNLFLDFLKWEILFPVPIALIPPGVVYFFLQPISSLSEITDLHILSFFPLVGLAVVCWPSGQKAVDFHPEGIICFLASILAYWIRGIPFSLWFGLVSFAQLVFAAAVVSGLMYIITLSKRFARFVGFNEKWTARWSALIFILAFVFVDLKRLTSLGVCFAETQDGSMRQISCFFLVYIAFISYSLFRFGNDIKSNIGTHSRLLVSWTKKVDDQFLFLFLWEISVLTFLSLFMFRGTTFSLLADLSRGPIVLGAFLSCAPCFLLMCSTSYFFKAIVKNHIDSKGVEGPCPNDTKSKYQWWSLTLFLSSIFYLSFFRYLSFDGEFGEWVAHTNFVQDVMIPELTNWGGAVAEGDGEGVVVLFVLMAFRYAWGFGLFLSAVLMCKWAVALNKGIFSVALISVATVPALISVRVFFPHFCVPGLIALISLGLMFACIPAASEAATANIYIFHGITFMALGLFDFYFLAPSAATAAQTLNAALPIDAPFVYGRWWWLWLWDDPFRYQFYHYHSFYYWPFFAPFSSAPWWVSPPLWSLSGDIWLVGATLAGFSHLGVFSAPPFLCGLFSFNLGAYIRVGKSKIFRYYLLAFCYMMVLLGGHCGSMVAILGGYSFFSLLRQVRYSRFGFSFPNAHFHCFIIVALMTLFYQDPSAYGIATSTAFSLALLSLGVFAAADMGNKLNKSKRSGSFVSFLMWSPFRISLIPAAVFLLHLGATIPHLSWTSLFSPFYQFFGWFPLPRFFFFAAEILFYPVYIGGFIFYFLWEIFLWIPIFGSIPGFLLSFVPGGLAGKGLAWFPAFCMFCLSIPTAPLPQAIFCVLVALLGRADQFEIAYLAAYINLFFLFLRSCTDSRRSFLTTILQCVVILAGGFLTRSFFFVSVSFSLLSAVLLPIWKSKLRWLKGDLFFLILVSVSLVFISWLSFGYAEEGGQLLGKLWGDEEERWELVEECTGKVLGWFGVKREEGDWEVAEDDIVNFVEQVMDVSAEVVANVLEMGCWVVGKHE